jgi:protein TonB
MRHIDPLRGAVMFEESLLESAHLLPRQSRWTTAASFGVQVAIGATLIIIPLLHPGLVALRAPEVILTAPAPIPPTPPPLQRVRVETASSATTAPPVQAMAQPVIGRTERYIDLTGSSDEPLPTGSSISMVGNNNPLAAIGTSTTTGPRVVIAAKPGPLTISRGVSAGMLLAPIQPVYPPIAKAAHQEGTVIIHAIISKDGRIESASVISGPGLLTGAALDAVRNAHYHPYLLNGQPTEVETTFSINFRMNAS